MTKHFVTISYKVKCIDSAKFMVSLLSNLADNFPEGIRKVKSNDSYERNVSMTV